MQVIIFNQPLMNIFSNYIPHKLIIVDDKDPAWMTYEKNNGQKACM